MPSKRTIGFFIVAVGIALGGGYLYYQERPVTVTGTSQTSSSWKLYGTDREGDHFYKPDTVRQTSPGIVVVLDQVLFTRQGKEEYIQKRQKYGFKTEGYDELSYRNVLYELNCFSKKREYSTQEVFELTKEGRKLDYARAGTYKDWQDVPPGSIIDQLCTIVCPEKRY